MGQIADQLRSLGFKETPLGKIERLYAEWKSAKTAFNKALIPQQRENIGKRIDFLKSQIYETCTKHKIGNPFEGQPILTELEYMKSVGQIK